jgi:hypothetical protein
MSETENEEKVESVEQEATIRADQGDGTKSTIRIKSSPEDIQKFKELLKKQNEVNKAIVDENAKLREENEQKKADFYPPQAPAGTAPLNEYQTSNLTNAERKIVDDALRDALYNLDEELPVDMLSFENDFEMISKLEKMADLGSKDAKVALAKILNKATEKSATYEYDGDPRDLYRKPKDEKEREQLNRRRRANWIKVK